MQSLKAFLYVEQYMLNGRFSNPSTRTTSPMKCMTYPILLSQSIIASHSAVTCVYNLDLSIGRIHNSSFFLWQTEPPAWQSRGIQQRTHTVVQKDDKLFVRLSSLDKPYASDKYNKGAGAEKWCKLNTVPSAEHQDCHGNQSRNEKDQKILRFFITANGTQACSSKHILSKMVLSWKVAMDNATNHAPVKLLFTPNYEKYHENATVNVIVWMVADCKILRFRLSTPELHNIAALIAAVLCTTRVSLKTMVYNCNSHSLSNRFLVPGFLAHFTKESTNLFTWAQRPILRIYSRDQFCFTGAS